MKYATQTVLIDNNAVKKTDDAVSVVNRTYLYCNIFCKIQYLHENN